jgi:hypothetical protein
VYSQSFLMLLYSEEEQYDLDAEDDVCRLGFGLRPSSPVALNWDRYALCNHLQFFVDMRL